MLISLVYISSAKTLFCRYRCGIRGERIGIYGYGNRSRFISSDRGKGVSLKGMAYLFGIIVLVAGITAIEAEKLAARY